MSGESLRGDHGYVDAQHDEQCRTGRPPKPVCEAEQAAIQHRRQRIKERTGRDRTNYPSVTGVAISGGGIRSASFGLGALQALQACVGVDGVDYLSTVSGGGYIGCSLTTASQSTEGGFPFTSAKPGDYSDTDSVKHIRDFSNYLIPHGGLDVVTAIGIIGRGLVANAIIVTPILLFFALITLISHPTVASLSEPRFLFWNFQSLTDKLGLQGWPAYWLTAIAITLNLGFLTFWAIFTSINLRTAATLHGGWVTVSKAFFFVTLVIVLIETQPFILWLINPIPAAAMTSGLPSEFAIRLHENLRSFWSPINVPVASVGATFASMGAIFALLSKYLVDIIAAAKRATGWLAWFKKISALAALWLGALVVPILLWFSYLLLTEIGLGCDWVLPIYLGAFAILLLLALIINPNRTSLFRLYRDRLSKAFLFDADPKHRDRYGDLKAYEPKLHQVDTDLCPYPIVNAALNIEGSQFANKRGRNADFFVFSPEYTGSDATGYVGTRRIEAEEAVLDLGSAMAISGAAISSNMGSETIKPLAFTLALLNLRLGYWLRNPNRVTGRWSWISQVLDGRSFLLFKEMFSLITEKSPTVYLTDGGHIENLGVYSLMKRRCELIIAIDAEADPTLGFGSFLILERYARIDLGATIDLPWSKIQECSLGTNAAFAAAADGSAVPSLNGPHCAAGEILYAPGETGILLYVKSSISGDESDYILDYKRRNPTFPHETTSDQFFGEEQLEAYRALGFHIMKGLLSGETPFLVTPREGETEDDARKRIRGVVSTALFGPERQSRTS